MPDNCGYGIFIDDVYNHFEFLGFVEGEQDPSKIKSGLTPEEKGNGRLWIRGSEKDKTLSEALKKGGTANVLSLKEVIKEYVKKNYLDPSTDGRTVFKFSRLL